LLEQIVPEVASIANGSAVIAMQTRTFGTQRGDPRKIDAWIEAVGREWGESEETMFGARLCVAELAANVIEHGIAKHADDHIIVTLERRSDGIGIEFLDSRSPFDPTRKTTAARSDSLDCALVGGRGLMLLHAYSKELAYRHDGTYNHVTLRIESR
jgi:anti-sigma regulatory factor (Ser/Thr protein kinase)